MGLKSNVKLIIQKTIRTVGRLFYRKHVWLVSDREWAAGDNGEAFFRYIQDKPVYSCFAISKDSPDYAMMKGVGNVVDHGSLKYKFLLCVADAHISSHEIHMAGHKETPQIFLSHGITFRDIHEYYNRMVHENFHVISTSKFERERLLTPPFKLKPEQVFVTGYPRYDRLIDGRGDKIITIAYTWRPFMWNASKEDFVKSEYYKLYSSVFDNKELISKILNAGYTIKVKPHPQLERYRDVIELPEGITFWDTDVSYREMYGKSSLIITDYSSAIFDFVYLYKPVIYYLLDYESLLASEYAGEYEYDYDGKGMGDVARNISELESILESYLKNDCTMKDLYKERVDSFFAYHDRNNCERVYNVVLDVLKK